MELKNQKEIRILGVLIVLLGGLWMFDTAISNSNYVTGYQAVVVSEVPGFNLAKGSNLVAITNGIGGKKVNEIPTRCTGMEVWILSSSGTPQKLRGTSTIPNFYKGQGMRIITNNACAFATDLTEAVTTNPIITLTPGNNFVGITKAMVGEKIGDLAGECAGKFETAKVGNRVIYGLTSINDIKFNAQAEGSAIELSVRSRCKFGKARENVESKVPGYNLDKKVSFLAITEGITSKPFSEIQGTCKDLGIQVIIAGKDTRIFGKIPSSYKGKGMRVSVSNDCAFSPDLRFATAPTEVSLKKGTNYLGITRAMLGKRYPNLAGECVGKFTRLRIGNDGNWIHDSSSSSAIALAFQGLTSSDEGKAMQVIMKEDCVFGRAPSTASTTPVVVTTPSDTGTTTPPADSSGTGTTTDPSAATTIATTMTISSVTLTEKDSFVAITPDMAGKQLEELKGTCELDPAYQNPLLSGAYRPIPANGIPASYEWKGMRVVTTTDDCEFNTGAIGTTSLPEYLSLVKGWNLVAITDAMIGREFQNYIGNCDVTHLRFASGESAQLYTERTRQDGTSLTYDGLIVTSEQKGKAMAVSVQNACTFLKDPNALTEEEKAAIAAMKSAVPGYNSLLPGWNLLSVSPDMEGQTLNQVKGTCEMSQASVFDGRQFLDIKSSWKTFASKHVGNALWLRIVNDEDGGCVFNPGAKRFDSSLNLIRGYNYVAITKNMIDETLGDVLRANSCYDGAYEKVQRHHPILSFTDMSISDKFMTSDEGKGVLIRTTQECTSQVKTDLSLHPDVVKISVKGKSGFFKLSELEVGDEPISVRVQVLNPGIAVSKSMRGNAIAWQASASIKLGDTIICHQGSQSVTPEDVPVSSVRIPFWTTNPGQCKIKELADYTITVKIDTTNVVIESDEDNNELGGVGGSTVAVVNAEAEDCDMTGDRQGFNYCDDGKKLRAQKAPAVACEAHYECMNDLCIYNDILDGSVCTDAQAANNLLTKGSLT